MSTLRQRKNIKKDANAANQAQCPPTVVKDVGFKFWGICTARNLILIFIILMITFYRLKIQQPSTPQKQQDLQSVNVANMIKQRKALPSNPILTTLYHRDITTTSVISQQYFDQAMILSAAFNHDEAIRSLSYALMYDAKCVMCHWGMAYNYGMNINRNNNEQRLSLAVKHANLAQKYSTETAPDQATLDLVDAMLSRFPSGRTMEDDVNKYLDIFKNAMQKLAEKYPGDADVLLLYAESLMNTMPWDYYHRAVNVESGLLEYSPKPDTIKVYAAVKRALEIAPNNLLALHLYIHIFEPDMKSVVSAQINVEGIADRMHDLLVPHLDEIRLFGIGHLIHMPSHIYIRIGRFEDANVANINAYKMAEEYYDYYNISDIHENYNQFYRTLYYCHRITFVVFSSMMNGQFAKADKNAKYLLDKCAFSTETISFFFENASWRDKNLIRFGKFEELIDNYEKNDEWKSKNVANNKYAPVQSAYARSFAYVSLGDEENCKKGYEIYNNEFLLGYNNKQIRDIMFVWQDAGVILDVSRSSFLGRYYDKCENDLDKSVVEWRNAAKYYDELAYMEPPFWPINNRACLGQVYLDRKEYGNAQKAFKEDLDQFVLNGWGLKGMIMTLQNIDPNGDEIKQYKKQFEEAWKYADSVIDKACY